MSDDRILIAMDYEMILLDLDLKVVNSVFPSKSIHKDVTRLYQATAITYPNTIGGVFIACEVVEKDFVGPFKKL